MLPAEAGAIELVNLLMPKAATNTAGATGGWVDASKYAGELVIFQNLGTLTAGTIDGKIQDATDDQGAGAADVSGATFTQVTTSNDAPNVQKLVIPANTRKYIRYLGTIVTGPADISVQMVARPRYL